ncbi:probable CYB2-lactate dehydrogenase cytochrome b2 [Rhynchosporium agropyri]|uniref:Probable CYB2-lactate dehydrogenase cytochrome b2 n=3 Tax=Rhynchosporium TaxID=38037 RepID=A0A1E1M5L1_RHYSE|nr:probable CYB2-lactate dehydrogenase cytochrome b2 [Rhynchosporium commune]CZT12894.1 probable CYB2-lactate dehydrogenase cytochrome b2 [Rhynchosporium agropyri]CZT44392.1 probable CYB2-lactate dehydrogenase cytochrome b2 [Rhynchosporium secalis]
MHSFLTVLPLVATALAARPYLNEPDTGIEDVLGSTAKGELPPLASMIGLPDFEWAARKYMNTTAYTYYRNGAAGEWSYRNNLEIFSRYRFRPRVLGADVTGIESTLPTTLLGYNFSMPIFISPAARGAYANVKGEEGLVKAAGEAGILYMASGFSSLTMEQISAMKVNNGTHGPQTLFQQIYLSENITKNEADFKRAQATGAKAIVMTVDSAGDGDRHRAARYGVGSADSAYTYQTWDYFKQLQALTPLPIIMKGIMTVEDAKIAYENGVKAIILSNHGARQLDGAPSSLETALEIYAEAPELFKKMEIYADGGVRYGSDVLKLLALGVKAVGLGRSFMYANCYGTEGVAKAISILRREISIDAANLGVPDLKKIDPSYVKWQNNNWWS